MRFLYEIYNLANQERYTKISVLYFLLSDRKISNWSLYIEQFRARFQICSFIDEKELAVATNFYNVDFS